MTAAAQPPPPPTRRSSSSCATVCLAGDLAELRAAADAARGRARDALRRSRGRDVRARRRQERRAVRCFVDVGVGTDGLLHSSELRAHGGTLEVEARVRVVVKSVDVERGRLGLALAPA